MRTLLENLREDRDKAHGLKFAGRWLVNDLDQAIARIEELERQLAQPEADVIEACHENGRVKSLDEIETAMIKYAIGRCRGNLTDTARVLGIGRSTLYRMLTKFGICGNAA